MRESTVAAFLEGSIALDELRAELHSAEVRVDSSTNELHVKSLDREFLLDRNMAVRVCESAIAGQLMPEELKLLAFILVTSERFTWGDDELLAEVLYDWSCPEVNYALTPANLAQFRRWLDGTESYPERLTTEPLRPGKVIARLVRKQL